MLSLALDNDSHHSAIIHMNKPDVFNVSITRARNTIYIYRSFDNSFNAGKIVSKYLSEIINKKPSLSSSKERDKFINEVVEELSRQNYEVWIGHSIAGILVDIVFSRENNVFGINLIGYPGHFVKALNTEDFKILSRAGLPTFPLPYTYWTFDKKSCIEEIISFSEPSGTTIQQPLT